MSSIVYRLLEPNDLTLLTDIDRSEHIVGFYTLENGGLTPDERVVDARRWDEAAIADYTVRSQSVLAHGGQAFGAWHGEQLVGFALLDCAGVGGDNEVVQLDLFYVSAPYRGRGISRRLLHVVSDAAQAVGATSIYISAMPSRNTVDAYLHMGARLLATPDPTLFAREPDDIHLILPLAPDTDTVAE